MAFRSFGSCATPAAMERHPLASSVLRWRASLDEKENLRVILYPNKGEHLAYKSIHCIFIIALSWLFKLLDYKDTSKLLHLPIIILLSVLLHIPGIGGMHMI